MIRDFSVDRDLHHRFGSGYLVRFRALLFTSVSILIRVKGFIVGLIISPDRNAIVLSTDIPCIDGSCAAGRFDRNSGITIQRTAFGQGNRTAVVGYLDSGISIDMLAVLYRDLSGSRIDHKALIFRVNDGSIHCDRSALIR